MRKRPIHLSYNGYLLCPLCLPDRLQWEWPISSGFVNRICLIICFVFVSASAPDLRAVAAAGVVVTFPIVFDMPWNSTYVAPVSWSLGWRSCESENLSFKHRIRQNRKKLFLTNIGCIDICQIAIVRFIPSYEVTADQCYHLPACHHNLTKPDCWQIAKQFAWEEPGKTICVRTVDGRGVTQPLKVLAWPLHLPSS